MTEFLIALLANITIVGVVAAALVQYRQIDIRLGWLALLLILFLAYFLALILGASLLPLRSWFPDLQWNWGGKLAAVLLWLAILRGLERWKTGFRAADAGFTLRQAPGSLKPVLVVTGLFLLLQVMLNLLMGDDARPDRETLLFQLLMPGLDEEPMFRGVLLYMAGLALAGKRFPVFGASMNWAGLLLVLLFGLVHGIAFQQGAWHISPLIVLITGFYGLVLLWLRERSGSLVMPILAHNLVNFVGQLV